MNVADESFTVFRSKVRCPRPGMRAKAEAAPVDSMTTVWNVLSVMVIVGVLAGQLQP